MTTENELILGAIADGHHQLSEIAEAVGLELKTASNRLYVLKQKGQVARRQDGPGWMLADGVSVPRDRVIPGARVHRIAEDGEDRPAPRKATKKVKAKPNGRRRPEPAAAEPRADMHDAHNPLGPPPPVKRALEFAISESGAVMFKPLHGERVGQIHEINCADALALFRLMSNVEFIRENA